MRILATADLHYDVARSVAPVERLAADVRRHGGDVLLIVGDACGRDLGILRRCLQLFDRFGGQILYVAGNHDLWTDHGDSLHRYEHELADVCREEGVWYLDAAPYVRDGVAFVGSVGWYDYTFRHARLGIPLRFYQHKTAPGAAARLGGLAHLVNGHGDVSEAMLSIGTRWMDGVHARLPMGDVAFTRWLYDRLARQLDEAAAQAEQIVAAVHHVPFAEFVHVSGHPSWDFAGAFLGSELFGDLLLSQPRVRYAFCGHSHRAQHIRKGHLECINVGCTYLMKRYEVVDLV